MPDGIHPLHILLVDDQPERRAELERTLASIGSGVEGAGTVLRALDRLAEGRPVDVVLVDEELAESTGFRTLTRCRPRSASKPLTVMMLDDPGRRSLYRGCGVDLYVQRPTSTSSAGRMLAHFASHTPSEVQRLSA